MPAATGANCPAGNPEGASHAGREIVGTSRGANPGFRRPGAWGVGRAGSIGNRRRSRGLAEPVAEDVASAWEVGRVGNVKPSGPRPR